MTAGSPSKKLPNATGYSHPAYAASLAEWGQPQALAGSGGWILARPIPQSSYEDAMGCYPLFACADWSQLRNDLENIEPGLVCLSLVTDPFGDYDVDYLRQCFPDLAIPFKQHFVIDLSRAHDTFVHPHHRRNARKALSEMQVNECTTDTDLAQEWTSLYSNLIARHQISGIAAFSKESFVKQLRVPGLTAFRAVRDELTLGMVLWYVQENRAYYHLAAYSAAGYERRASFALFDHSIEYFAKHGVEWLSLGAGAGSSATTESGLNRFKQGWSTGTRTAYFCGRVFDPDKYQELVRIRNPGTTSYFPAYRVGEFS